MRPVLMVVDNQPADLERMRQALERRYGVDYDVVCEDTAGAALRQLKAFHADAVAVATLFVAVQVGAVTWGDVLEQAHELHPRAKRVLLIPFGNRAASKPIMKAMSLGQVDRYAVKPTHLPDEAFYSLANELLRDWQRQQGSQSVVVNIVGTPWDARCFELRDVLHRSGVPYAFHEASSPGGQALLSQVDRPNGPFPVVVVYDGQVLANPSNEEAAVALGARHSDVEGIFDVVIVGAGPAGLSAAVYGASEGLRTLVVDRETIGGQAGTSSLIRNFLGFPFGISGAELTHRALDQAWSFGAETSVMRDVIDLTAEGKHRAIVFADGLRVVTRTVVLAMGASYQRLGVPALEALVGAGVFYGGGVTEAQAMVGRHVFVAGAGNSAGQAAVHLAKYAKQVTMLVRGNDLGRSMSDYLVQEIHGTENIDVRFRTAIVDGQGVQRLEHLVLRNLETDVTETVPATALFVLIGATPRTDWLPLSIQRDKRGFVLTGTDIHIAQADAGITAIRSPLVLETSMPGVFAAGDVRHGSVKRVASAVGEGGIVIQSVHEYLSRS